MLDGFIVMYATIRTKEKKEVLFVSFELFSNMKFDQKSPVHPLSESMGDGTSMTHKHTHEQNYDIYFSQSQR